MNVFELDRAMIDEYEAFSRSFTRIKVDDIRAQLDAAYETRKYWPEPIIQIEGRCGCYEEISNSVDDLARDSACGKAPAAGTPKSSGSQRIAK